MLFLIRKVVSFALLVAAAIALVFFFMGSASIVIDPIVAAFDPFDFSKLGAALYGFIQALSVPLIMFMLGIIGLTMNKEGK